MTTPPRPPRPASTLVLVRDSANGLEVFLMQRSKEASFMAGAYVFPGGALDASDTAIAESAVVGLDASRANRLLGTDKDGLAYWVAAVRECFEESGLLLAEDDSGQLVRLEDDAEINTLRQQLNDGAITISALCAQRGWRLALQHLAYLSHWTTPIGTPKRFETRFFVAVAPQGQTGHHDNAETIAHAWMTPDLALKRSADGEILLAHATQSTLRMMQQFADTTALMAFARSERDVPAMHPRVSTSRNGRRVLTQDDFAYAEIAKLDPDGIGTFWSEIVPGATTVLAPTVRRIAAPNPGFMTGPGTNAYIVGSADELAVIDPGPDLPEHIERLVQECGAALKYIITTHTHRDHSPGAQRLKQLTGAEIIGMPAPATEFQDDSFEPDRIPHDGERLRIGDCTLRVIHTPGHASNHCCFLLEEEQMLFSGDHIMQGSTVVINPPDGDMAIYLASLRKIEKEAIAWIAPGHGFLMDRPAERVRRLLAHRQARETKVIASLRDSGPLALSALLALVYNDVPVQRHEMAARSLRAHLLKLLDDGHAIESNGLWQLKLGHVQ